MSRCPLAVSAEVQWSPARWLGLRWLDSQLALSLKSENFQLGIVLIKTK